MQLLFFDTFSHDATGVGGGELNLDLVQFPRDGNLKVVVILLRVVSKVNLASDCLHKSKGPIRSQGAKLLSFSQG